MPGATSSSHCNEDNACEIWGTLGYLVRTASARGALTSEGLIGEIVWAAQEMIGTDQGHQPSHVAPSTASPSDFRNVKSKSKQKRKLRKSEAAFKIAPTDNSAFKSDPTQGKESPNEQQADSSEHSVSGPKNAGATDKKPPEGGAAAISIRGE